MKHLGQDDNQEKHNGGTGPFDLSTCTQELGFPFTLCLFRASSSMPFVVFRYFQFYG